jgi:hypothetical protein
MPRPCKLCTHPDQEAVRLALANGTTDRAIGVQFNISHVSVGRHRREHVVRPMQAAAAALDRGRGIRDQREQLVKQAEAGDASAYLALSSIIADLRKVHERLERQADAAEQDNQRLAVASLSAQQLRAAEVRAKIGGVGGYAAQKANGPGDGVPFTINFVFSGGASQQFTLDGAAEVKPATERGARSGIMIIPSEEDLPDAGGDPLERDRP